MVAGAALAVLVLASAGGAEMFRWTDADGVDHYTTNRARIPDRYRSTVRVIDTPTPTGPEAPPEAGAMRVDAGAPILIDAHVNGVPFRLVVDTGASHTIIAPAVLERAGVDITRGRRIRIVGVTGAVEARAVVVPRLDVAGASLGPLTVIAHDVPALPAAGLLGRDVLDSFVLTIDPARGRATLQR